MLTKCNIGNILINDIFTKWLQGELVHVIVIYYNQFAVFELSYYIFL